MPIITEWEQSQFSANTIGLKNSHVIQTPLKTR